MNWKALLKKEIIARLSENQDEITTLTKQFDFLLEEPKPAAVLVPLLQIKGSKNWHLLFTHRTHTVADHKGQVAFPGGRCEDGDPSIIDTALREAKEEIGLQSPDVQIIGRLRGLQTITNYWVTPIVGIIKWPFKVQLHPEEVTRIFTIPLDWLASPTNMETRDRIISLPDHINRTVQVIYFKPYDDEILWGVSAEITLSLLETLGKTKQGAGL